MSEMLQTPVGLAITFVTVVNEPFGSRDTERLVINGGMEKVVWPSESVVEMMSGVESVETGGTVTVLV